MLGSIITTLVLSLGVLVLSGRWVIQLLGNIAVALGVSEFTLAFVFLAVATSAPELFVSISSAQKGAGELVLAVALGSNIVNMTLIVGLAAIISFGINTAGLSLRRDVLIGMAVTVLPLIFLLDGVISRLDGLLLLAAFAFYIFLLKKDARRYNHSRIPRNLSRGIGSAILVLVLVAIVIIAANVTVTSSVKLASFLNLPPFIIGLFLLAIGTSLPEMTTTLQAALQNKPTMALGNILGSNVADSALIVGIASLVRPLHVPITPTLITTAGWVIVSLCAIGYFAFSRKKITFSEGLILLLLFFLFAGSTLLTNIPV